MVYCIPARLVEYSFFRGWRKIGAEKVEPRKLPIEWVFSPSERFFHGKIPFESSLDKGERQWSDLKRDNEWET